jgi:hypothetical protein
MKMSFLTRANWLTLSIAVLSVGIVSAETPDSKNITEVTADYVAPARTDSGVIQASGCSSCGTASDAPLPPRNGDCCGGDCVPGGTGCVPCDAQGGFGGLYCHIYNALCCKDPCYEPRWVAGANAAFFVDGARPVTQTRLRWDSGRNLVLPDRNEYFWARIGGRGPGNVERRVNYNELSIYQEAATERFSAFVVMPYRALSTQDNGSASGFGDMIVGTKSLLLDTEVVQLSLQFSTYIPISSTSKGISTGNVALEPSLLIAIKLLPETYFQGQIGEWIPLGGDSDYAGALMRYSFSFNHVLARPWADSQLIATLEFNGFCFQDGLFTDPATGIPVSSSNATNYFGVGPGFRWVISKDCDLGVGMNFATTKQHFADQVYRSEFRFRF